MEECYFKYFNFAKSNSSPEVFFMFLNCTSGTKSRKASYIENS